MTTTQAAERADALLALIGAASAPRTSHSPAPATTFTGPVVLIDGRSGSGKTDLADALAERWPTPVTLVHLDDIYPGWDGLDAASDHLHTELLSSPAPRWQRYDWSTGAPTDWTTVDPTLPLIVEGVGALTRRNAALATLRVWIDLDDTTRRDRALARDGAAYEPHWTRWAAHERDFIAREHPAALADVTFADS